MRKKNLLEKLIADIKSLKIQSATTIAVVSLKVVKEEIKEGKIKTKEELKDIFLRIENARITEPFLKNCFNYLLWQTEKENPADLKKTLPFYNLLLQRLDLIREQILETGVKVIKNGFNVFTHCHSTNVEEILKRGQRKGLNFSVYLTETRPKFQGRITAENLAVSGLKVTMITDSQATFLISREDQIKIDIVILGTDAIFPDGSCYNKSGSYGISLSAKGAKIPVYIAGSLLKYSPEILAIEERAEMEVWKDKPKKLKILNPAFDKIPAIFISKYITEFGLLEPKEIEKQVKKNYPWIFQEKQEKKEKQEMEYSYLHLGEKIDKEKHIIATFRLESEGRISEAASELAAESSVGTWTDLTTQTREIFERLSAKVFEIEKKTKIIKVAYPLELFEPENIPQLLSSVAGNIFGLKKIKWLRLLDLELPEAYVKTYPGSQIGADKIRELVGFIDRPIIGCIIKPKMGLSWNEHVKIAEEVFEAGVDLVKDDENLTDQNFNPFEKRVYEICKIMKEKGWIGKEKMEGGEWKIEKKGKIYAFNITGETEKMVERARFVKNNGGNCVMVDIITAGFSALQTLRKQNLGLIIHGHRAMHGAITKNPKQGISMLVLAKLARLAGVDELHTGTVIGKMEGTKEEVIEINNFLLSDWFSLKKTLPIASGGLHPLLIPDLIKILGREVILNFGGGIHGHPLGSKAGVLAVKQAIEAVKKGVKLEKYGESHEELRVAIERWGNK